MCVVLRWGRLEAGHLPILLAIEMSLTMALTYIVAVYRQDVDPLLPYISGAATRAPESCVFAQLLNLGAFLTLLVVYLRYRLVDEFNRDSDRSLRLLNTVGLVWGCLAVFGMSLVANFQETALRPVHLTGALSCFGFGCLYFVTHAVVTWKMYPLYTGRTICIVRATIALISCLVFPASVTTGILAGIVYSESHDGQPSPHPWTGQLIHEAGYRYHLASAVLEWSLTALFGAFLLSFSRDLEKLRVSMVAEPLVLHLDDSPVGSPRRRGSRRAFVDGGDTSSILSAANAP